MPLVGAWHLLSIKPWQVLCLKHISCNAISSSLFSLLLTALSDVTYCVVRDSVSQSSWAHGQFPAHLPSCRMPIGCCTDCVCLHAWSHPLGRVSGELLHRVPMHLGFRSLQVPVSVVKRSHSCSSGCTGADYMACLLALSTWDPKSSPLGVLHPNC